ncbi:hypothetical protein CF319_g4991 [Tilletia indica]|nr:hypothetical protein CF319_g4991 [Tilletia indica]
MASPGRTPGPLSQSTTSSTQWTPSPDFQQLPSHTAPPGMSPSTSPPGSNTASVLDYLTATNTAFVTPPPRRRRRFPHPRFALHSAPDTTSTVREQMSHAVDDTYGVHPFQLASTNFRLPYGAPPIQSAIASNALEYVQELLDTVIEASDTGHPELAWLPLHTEWLGRVEVLEWLLHVHISCDMASETLWLAINIFNRHLSLTVYRPVSLRPVALAALCIAGKYEENVHPKYRNLIHFLDGTIGARGDLLRAEEAIIATLQYRFSRYASPIQCLWLIAMVDNVSMHPRIAGKIIVESTITDLDHVAVAPWTLAATALYVGVRVCARHWNSNYVQKSGFTEDDLLPGANRLIRLLRKDEYTQSFVYKRYATATHGHGSVKLRSWALHNKL